jgi:hypothetical protein
VGDTIAKICQKCKCPIYGKARKWCPDCARKQHLNQMSDYYCKNTSRWQFGGRYFENQNQDKIGSGSLGSHKLDDPIKEAEQIFKELQNVILFD